MGYANRCTILALVSCLIAMGGYLTYLKFDELEYALKSSDFIEICKRIEANHSNTVTVIRKFSTESLWTAFQYAENTTALSNIVLYQIIDATDSKLIVTATQPNCEPGYVFLKNPERCVYNPHRADETFAMVSDVSLDMGTESGRKRIISTLMTCNNNNKVYIINTPVKVVKFAE